MNLLVISLFVGVFATGYFAGQLGVVPQYSILLAELLSGIALLVVIARVVVGRRVMLDWRYGAFLIAFFLVLIFGFLVQSVPEGAMVAGLRNYVKFIPFFLLPAVYPFTRTQLKVQLIVLMTVAFLQSPLAVYQRFVQFADSMHTGDPIRGMLTSSSGLSLFMMCGVALFVTLYLRRRIALSALLIAAAVLLVPTTLNETKGTLVMLPVAVLAPALLTPARFRPMQRIVPLVAVGAAAMVVFVAVYDTLIQNRRSGTPIASFFMEGNVENYLYTGYAEGDARWVGRIDSITIALDRLSEDPLALAFGLGAGNVSKASLPGFEGEYAAYYDRYGVDVTQLSYFLWEIGIFGLLCYLLLYWFVFRDARMLAKSDGPMAVYGHVWATVIILMTMGLLYKSVFTMNEVAYLFWFYCGLIARHACAERTARRHRSNVRGAAPPGRPFGGRAQQEPMPGSLALGR